MRLPTTPWLSLPTLLLSLSSAALLVLAPPAQAATRGSGQSASEVRPVGDFDAIAISGPFELQLRQGAQQAVTLTADDNLLALIETVVETRDGGATLVIRFKRGEDVRPRSPLRVSVDAVRLRALALAGSGKVEVNGLQTPALKLTLAGASDARLQALVTDSLELRIAGSGDVRADGTARSLSLSIAGSGDARLAGLKADAVKVSIAGSGDAQVTANRTLLVSIAGSGDVEYGGDVSAVTSKVAGSGSVRRR
ncbi:MAG: head GIN domain-containing protein [Rubrivivax sp.]|nr:head GIN domain-containing protein [Rubrivivax sp.]